MPTAVKESVAEFVIARAEARCELYTLGPGGGRCARSVKIEIHHLVPRSKGGGHEPDNLSCVCVFHHRAIEHRQVGEDDWIWEAEGEDGQTAYSLSNGGPAEIVLWPNVRDELEERSTLLMHEAKVGVLTADVQGPWQIARAAFELAEGGDLWKLHDMTLAEFAYSLGKQTKTIKAYILAETRLMSIAEKWHSVFHSAPIKLMQFCGAEIVEMSDKQLRELKRMIESGDSIRAVIERAREIADVEASAKVGLLVYNVILSANATTLEFNVKVEEGTRQWRKEAIDKAIDAFENRKYVVGVEWPETTEGHTVALVSAEGEDE